MKLNCPECANDIHTKDINLNNMVAKCRQCSKSFGFGDGFKNAPPSHPIARPKKVNVQKTGSSLQLSYRWFTGWAFVITIITILWNIYVVFSISSRADIFHYTDGKLTFNSLQGLFPTIIFPHVWIGLFLIYYTLALYINKSAITASFNQLKIRHTPLPWWGNYTIQRADIKQIYTKNTDTHDDNEKQHTYAVYVILQDDTHKSLLPGLRKPDIALYIEQELEAYWGIQNKRVSREYNYKFGFDD